MKTDQQIIIEVLAGESEAFSSLVQRYQRSIFGLAYRRLGDVALAEDVTQECFLKAYSSLSKFRNDSSFLWWISRITLNLIYDRLHSQKYRREIELSEDLVDRDENNSPLKLLEDKLKVKRLQSSISSLKSHYADVLTLGLLEGKSYQEIASILSVPSGTVASRMNKALELLRKKFFGNSKDE